MPLSPKKLLVEEIPGQSFKGVRLKWLYLIWCCIGFIANMRAPIIALMKIDRISHDTFYFANSQSVKQGLSVFHTKVSIRVVFIADDDTFVAERMTSDYNYRAVMCNDLQPCHWLRLDSIYTFHSIALGVSIIKKGNVIPSRFPTLKHSFWNHRSFVYSCYWLSHVLKCCFTGLDGAITSALILHSMGKVNHANVSYKYI